MGCDQDRDARPLDRWRTESGVSKPVVITGEGGALLGHQERDHLDGFLEPIHAFRRWRQLDAIAAMLILVPAGPDPQGEPAFADVVDGHGLLEQDGRVAERVAGDEDPEADAGRPRRDGREQGPAFETAMFRRAVGIDEVVDQPRVVEPQFLSLEHVVEHVGPRPIGLAQEHPEAQPRKVGRSPAAACRVS